MIIEFMFLRDGRVERLDIVEERVRIYVINNNGGTDSRRMYGFVITSGVDILEHYDRINIVTIGRWCKRYHNGKHVGILRKFLLDDYKFKAIWR